MANIINIILLILCVIMALFSSALALWTIIAIRTEERMRNPKTKDDWRWP